MPLKIKEISNINFNSMELYLNLSLYWHEKNKYIILNNLIKDTNSNDNIQIKNEKEKLENKFFFKKK